MRMLHNIIHNYQSRVNTMAADVLVPVRRQHTGNHRHDEWGGQSAMEAGRCISEVSQHNDISFATAFKCIAAKCWQFCLGPNVLTWAQTNCPPFWRRDFHMNILERKCLNVDLNFARVQLTKISVDSGNGIYAVQVNNDIWSSIIPWNYNPLRKDIKMIYDTVISTILYIMWL